uniref:Uncharacterized protein n=1 Tax=Panagrolaimus davidi TaxID=227884 RepID=A0A914P7D4_9BILA
MNAKGFIAAQNINGLPRQSNLFELLYDFHIDKVTRTPLEADDSESAETADTEELRAEDASEAEDDTLTAIYLIYQQKNTNIEIAKRGQKRQAEKMLESSAKRFKPLEVGQNVTLILDKQDDFYKVGTKHGRFDQLFARNQLEPVSENFMDVSEVPDIVAKSVRTVAADNPISGGQGHIHCNCKGRCQDKKCKCRRENRLCNSRCHNSLTCTNK